MTTWYGVSKKKSTSRHFPPNYGLSRNHTNLSQRAGIVVYSCIICNCCIIPSINYAIYSILGNGNREDNGAGEVKSTQSSSFPEAVILLAEAEGCALKVCMHMHA